jgi:hypothetical protein
MSLRDRILPIQTEPETVERAPRRERWKRQAWLLGSTIIAFIPAFVAVWLLTRWVGAIPTDGYIGIVIVVGLLGTSFLFDLWLFSWGVERFDLIPPWQFREADDARD